MGVLGVNTRLINRWFITWLLFLIVVFAILLYPPFWKNRLVTPLTNVHLLNPSPPVDPWTAAAEKVKADRGEPEGRQAKVDIPSELRQYADTRRFLAIQVGEVAEHKIKTPKDFVDLGTMLEDGSLVPVPPVDEDYVLFGVGGSADSEAFTRFEKGKSVSIYNQAQLTAEYDRLANTRKSAQDQLTSLQQQVKGLKRRERSRRAQLQKDIATANQTLKTAADRKALLDHYYNDPASRDALFADYQSLERQGTKLFNSPANLDDPTTRQRLKVQMLSSLRPEALRMLKEIATAYRQQFDRPLPVTSLVRPDEYQLELSRTNANATRIDTPPHSTGLAFDILYRYMTAAEQTFLMTLLARLEDDGRIEVLRENRDHYHVFAFVDAARPGEQYIAAALGVVRPGKVATSEAESAAHVRGSKKAEANHGRSKTWESKVAKKRESKTTKRKAARAPAKKAKTKRRR